MGTDVLGDAQYLMRKIVALEAAEVAAMHPWLRESDRWNELVFALLTRIADIPEPTLRGVIDAMSSVGLLDVSTLAGIRCGQRGPDIGTPHVRRILEFLEEVGMDPEEARQGLIAVCEAALGLQEHYGGKVQRYLRSYGELMLKDLGCTFQFTALSDVEVKRAFTYWLQNVLNMPVSLLDENVHKFCDEHGLTPEQWLTAADELDVSVALVDDLVQRYLTRQAASGEGAAKGAKANV